MVDGGSLGNTRFKYGPPAVKESCLDGTGGCHTQVGFKKLGFQDDDIERVKRMEMMGGEELWHKVIFHNLPPSLLYT